MGGMKDTLGDRPYDLFSGSPPHRAHSPTSKAAADGIKQKIGPLHAKILDWLKVNPAGGTDEQIGDALKIPPNTFRPRRRELQLMSRVEDSGKTAPTKSGRAAILWTLWHD